MWRSSWSLEVRTYRWMCRGLWCEKKLILILSFMEHNIQYKVLLIRCCWKKGCHFYKRTSKVQRFQFVILIYYYVIIQSAELSGKSFLLVLKLQIRCWVLAEELLSLAKVKFPNKVNIGHKMDFLLWLKTWWWVLTTNFILCESEIFLPLSISVTRNLHIHLWLKLLMVA